METIHDLPGWGNATIREMHMWKETIEWVNSEQRSATNSPRDQSPKANALHLMKGNVPWPFGKKMNAIPKLFLTLIGGDHSRVACFARDLR